MCYVSNGYIFYALTYLELWPDYICDTNIIKPPQECDHTVMCKYPNDPSIIRINTTSTHTLDNWVDRLDLVCQPAWKIGLIGSMYLFGWSIGCLFVPRFGDVYGRKWPFMISMGASIIFHLGLTLSKNIDLTSALFFLLGLCTPGNSNIAYVYLIELVPLKW